jgi:hypothetical protein
MLVVITFAGGKRFGLVDISQRALEGNTAVARKDEESKAILPTIYGASFRGLRIVKMMHSYHRIAGLKIYNEASEGMWTS